MMIVKSINRSWVSPLTTVSFVAVGGTGLLMLLGVRLPGMGEVHEWIGAIFLASVALHMVLNWSALVALLKSKVTLAIVLVTGFLMAGLFLADSGEKRGPGGPDQRPPMSQEE